MSSDGSKKARTGKRIGTHDGTFHCDEALACFLLKRTKAYEGASVTRTRDPAVLETMDAVVDVGGTYEPEKMRYDHHQRGFEETFDAKHKTKLSSAGLVYKHHGREVIAGLMPGQPEATVELIFQKMYDNVIEELDAVDNGISAYPADLTPKYRTSSSLPQRVGGLNPYWNEESNDIDERFAKASELAGSEFIDQANYYIKAWLPARALVEKALAKRGEVDKSGQIIVFETGCPWKEHLFELEADAKLPAPLLYTLYPDQGGKWRVQCVPERPDSFNSRKPLPAAWQGVRDQALSDLSGIKGCIFVHASGFIGGCDSYEGALKMAQMSIEGV